MARTEMPARLNTASPLLLGILCAAAGAAVLLRLTSLGWSGAHVLLWSCLAYAAPGLAFELARKSAVYRRPLQPIRWRRVWARSVGLAQIFGVAFVVYYALPEYGNPRYHAANEIMPGLAVILVAASPVYFAICEAVLQRKRDCYEYIGTYTILRFIARVWTRPVLRRFLLLWLVKLFFLPLMIGSLAYSVDWLARNPWAGVVNFYNFFDYYWEVILALDVLLAIVGYVCSLRLFGTEVVHTDETWRGWVATLICYAPFSTVLYGSYLTYEDDIKWGNVFQGNMGLYVAYGCLLLIVHTLYLLASLSFGIRYSNLSHRGILTDGLFRLTKHPAYLFKQIIWWMVALPFISATSWVDAVLNCAVLLAVNCVYWWRGRTEEINLSRDPAYVAYALSMNERSILRWVGRVFPVFAYKAPAGYKGPLTMPQTPPSAPASLPQPSPA